MVVFSRYVPRSGVTGSYGSSIFSFLLLLLLFLFLAALGLRCCVWAFFSCGERGLLFVALHVLLIAVASLVAETGL